VIFSGRLASSIWMDWTSKKTCPVSILFVCARDISWACSLYTSDGSFFFLLVNTLHADGRLMFDPLDTPNSSAFPERMFWRPWKTIQKPR
jgi:hypothetical protein